MTKLIAKTLTSKKALKEIVALYPTTKSIARKHVAGIGYVLTAKDSELKSLCHVYKENLTLVAHKAV